MDRQIFEQSWFFEQSCLVFRTILVSFLQSLRKMDLLPVPWDAEAFSAVALSMEYGFTIQIRRVQPVSVPGRGGSSSRQPKIAGLTTHFRRAQPLSLREAEPLDLSDDPIEATVQFQMNMPKRLAEHCKETAKAITPKKN